METNDKPLINFKSIFQIFSYHIISFKSGVDSDISYNVNLTEIIESRDPKAWMFGGPKKNEIDGFLNSKT